MHNLRAFANGVEFANVNFTVVTLTPEEFPTGLRGEYTLADFPIAGSSPKVRWSEPHQNFVFARAVTIPSAPAVPENPRTRLESPSQGSFESGIGLIRGWVCNAERDGNQHQRRRPGHRNSLTVPSAVDTVAVLRRRQRRFVRSDYWKISWAMAFTTCARSSTGWNSTTSTLRSPLWEPKRRS
ncbi:MAG: hypothetical protein U5O69_03710 [Candidatus Competibacteraceae bacterium]|nr:hypothetical protein [Candidatus Competibacteraceae bacterium]